jgi:hypothetical protein
MALLSRRPARSSRSVPVHLGQSIHHASHVARGVTSNNPAVVFPVNSQQPSFSHPGHFTAVAISLMVSVALTFASAIGGSALRHLSLLTTTGLKEDWLISVALSLAPQRPVSRAALAPVTSQLAACSSSTLSRFRSAGSSSGRLLRLRSCRQWLLERHRSVLQPPRMAATAGVRMIRAQ